MLSLHVLDVGPEVIEENSRVSLSEFRSNARAMPWSGFAVLAVSMASP